MNRSITILIALVLAALAPAKVAFAQAKPTPAEIEQAKKAFGEGKALFEEGKFAEAADKFKESYKLSKNPILLYNIGHTLDQMGARDKALFYYRKFLADAPKAAAQRKDVEKRVEDIEKQNLEDDLNGTSAPPPDTTQHTQPTKPPEEAEVKAKPAGTYKATDFQTQVVDSAPPGKNLDVTAVVPKDSGWTVTLYFRGMGDTKWIAKPMRWRYNELVARIPGNKIGGSTIQYYIDAKDASGTLIARSGKSTSPNLVNVDASVAPRNYPDFTDEEQGSTQTQVVPQNNVDEDPLHPNAHPQPQPNLNVAPVDNGMGNGMGAQEDLNPNKYTKKKWIATGIAGGLLGLAVLTYVLGARQANNLTTDATTAMGGAECMSPCHMFDKYDADVEKAGKSMNTYHTLTALTGVIAGSVAVYYWYKEHKLKKRLRANGGSPGGNDSRPAAPAAPAHDEFSLVPAVGEGFAGAAAIGRF